MSGRYNKIGRLCCFVLFFALCICLNPVKAADTAGKVLYHQDFSVVSSAAASGVTAGTNNAGEYELAVRDGALAVRAHDSKRVYAVLPEFSSPDTYTMKFDFRFADRTEGHVETGYLGVILSCQGEEPSNIIGIRIHQNGVIDDSEKPGEGFADLDEELIKAINSGEKITVEIPVVDNYMHSMTIITDGREYTVFRDERLELTPDSHKGFSVRNAYAAVEEVWVVSGVGYTEMTGYYAEHSFRDDGGMGQPDLPYSPATWDGVWVWLGLAVSSAAVLCRRRYGR